MSGPTSRLVWYLFAIISFPAVISLLWLPVVAHRRATWSENYYSFLDEHSFLCGCVGGIIFIPLFKNATKALYGFCFRRNHEDKLYGLDHALLNIEMPPSTMWMNMGYWKHTQSFPEACTALLEKVLQTAGLLNYDKRPLDSSDPSIRRIIDVGCGCGDQTIYLAQRCRMDSHSLGSESRPPCDYYVGINVNQNQADFARQRIESTAKGKNIHIFSADAADPRSWSHELKNAVTAASQQEPGAKQSETIQTWLLALDTLYHFKPSREPLLSYAARKLGASFMAFDLVLADSITPINSFLLRIVCFMSSIPFSNFKTLSEYSDMLVRAGYAADKIEMHDISESVFSGIGAYMEQREVELKKFKMSLGKLRVAGKIFSWWGRNNVVRGVIVVARKDNKSGHF